jgi:dipeptidyl-peptidase 4
MIWSEVSCKSGSVWRRFAVASLLTIGMSYSFVFAAPSVPDLSALVSTEFEPKVFGPAKWLDEGASYATLENSASVHDAKEVVRYDTRTGLRSVLVDARALIPVGAEKPLSIDDYELSKDERRLLIYTHAEKVWRQKTRGDYWVLDRETGQLRQLGGQSPPGSLMFASFAPDGRHVAYLRRDLGLQVMATNLYVENWATGRITPLTSDAEVRNPEGGGRYVINGTGDWVNEEEFDLRKGYEWSPDSQSIVYWQFDATAVRDFLLINNTDTLYPVVTPIPYPIAGTPNSSVRIGIVASSGGATRWIDLDGDPANYYVPRLSWSPDSKTVLVQQLDRPQQNLDLIAADAATAQVRHLLHEHATTWIEVVNDFKWLHEGREFLWVSERDGWRHAYVVARDGGKPRLITPGPFDVTGIAGVDEKEGLLYYLASPQDATRRQLYRSHLNGRGVAARVTPTVAGGTHSYDVSPGGRWAFHTVSSFDSPPSTDLVSLPDHRSWRALNDNAALRAKLGSLLAAPVEFFHVDIPGGVTLDGMMLKPPSFDPGKQYPVLVHVYGEPGAQMVLDRWGGRHILFHRLLAEQGYIVLTIDNRGTPAPKGHAWRHSIYGSVGVLASQDQASALRVLAAQRPYLDLNRVAVWGWSGGGSMALNLMFRFPDLYKVGMSVASMSDQRYYDTIYQERYMGTPERNSDGYHRGSPINYAEGLAGQLLIVSGSGDDNCHFQVTQLLLNRLIGLGKHFDFMEYPNRSHSLDEGQGTLAHLYGTLQRYLTTHLPVAMPTRVAGDQ